MAEGVRCEVPNLGAKYFCHQCSKEVSPYQSAEVSIICPECQSGFLEEVSRDLYLEDLPESYDYESYFDGDEDAFALDLISHRRLLNTLLSSEDEEAHSSETDLSGIEPIARQNPDSSVADAYSPRFRDEYISDSDAQFLRMRFYDEYSADSEVDALASQLLDEVDISGPAPLCKDQIKSLPVIILTEEHIGSELQCTICMNDYKIGEKAKQLTCEHLFHEKCITPWLERQASCPNCRSIVKAECKSKRSLSCPRTISLRPRSSSSSNGRRFSEVSSLGDFFTASMNMNPFRFL